AVGSKRQRRDGAARPEALDLLQCVRVKYPHDVVPVPGGHPPAIRGEDRAGSRVAGHGPQCLSGQSLKVSPLRPAAARLLRVHCKTEDRADRRRVAVFPELLSELELADIQVIARYPSLPLGDGLSLAGRSTGVRLLIPRFLSHVPLVSGDQLGILCSEGL